MTINLHVNYVTLQATHQFSFGAIQLYLTNRLALY